MPFVQTALMHDGKGENIIHFAAFKIRVVGTGNLDSSLFGLNSVLGQTLVPLPMLAVNEDEPVVLSNFSSQKAMLRLSTDQIDEIFDITRVILYVRQLWTDYPR